MENDLLYNEKWEDGSKSLEDGSVDLIITDPPYGVDHVKSKFFDDSFEYVSEQSKVWLSEMYRVLKDTSHIYVFVPTLQMDLWIMRLRESGFTLNNILATNTFNTNRYIKNNFKFDLQLILYASKGQAKRLNQVDWIKTSDSWLNDKRNTNPHPYTYSYTSFISPEYGRANVKHTKGHDLHPNQKNHELIEKFILLSSNEQDVVLDPFFGSGSTIKASINTNRNYVGYDKDEQFFKNLYNLISK